MNKPTLAGEDLREASQATHKLAYGNADPSMFDTIVLLFALWQMENGGREHVNAAIRIRRELTHRGECVTGEAWDVQPVTREDRLHNAMARYEAGIREYRRGRRYQWTK